ncbi:hypothetical protein E7Z57_24305 (plasmid) [Ralstonia pseudosolanacearum]|uniref:Uncharacterized protein n=1 Tax=Ralstonia solanacearum TaxID=305 RepID=A0AA92EHV1_RALSL|nr:hypothetical protein E7Z57_24305 [Ralstonia pseudosolanacearum]
MRSPASAVAANASGLKISERITLPISAMFTLARVEHPRNGAAQIRQPPGSAGRDNRRAGSA